ncbi:MAG: glutamate synthase subunit beta [Polyangiaceae bacterium]|nr:glutamate synthase subunit beta [Polyangiaceae bacterium]
MGKITGFLEYERTDAAKRPPELRILDHRELELPISAEALRQEGARCMDCGIPFCNTGCPLGNLIPDWNHASYEGREADASALLHATNGFPEVTGRVCPAPCEAACVLGIGAEPVGIKLIERTIADRAWEAGLVVPRPPRRATGRRVAVVGSGPAGLSAAQQLRRAGHEVTVFERADRLGGLLTYGIPDFKLEKRVVQRRVELMRAEGVRFETGVEVGRDLDAVALRERFHAVVLAIGARVPRDLEVPGRELAGVHFAMDYLEQENRRVAGDAVPEGAAILAGGKHVIVIGGGDTGSDCIGTAHRQGARSVTNLELLPRPPDERSPTTPWPSWPLQYRESSSHEEGGQREFSILTERLEGKGGAVTSLHAVRVRLVGGRPERMPGTELVIPAELVLLAMGFVRPERAGLLEQLGVALDARGNARVDRRTRMTSVPGVFAAGDCQRGQSLVVWALADGRSAAREADRWLMGETELP